MRLRIKLSRGALVLMAAAALICATTTVIKPVQSSQQSPGEPRPVSDKQQAAAAGEPAASPAPAAGKQAEPAGEPDQRKGRSPEASVPAPEPAKEAAKADDKAKPADSPTADAKKPAGQKASPAAGASQRQQSAPAAKSAGAAKPKLPANLGTVTSTGSGGPSHYMSKHDAYSAIAEKHGAVAHEAVRQGHRSGPDRRSHLQRFGGIQKASGIGDMLSPFKGVTDSGLARTLGASMRSIMKGKYSIPAYLASAVLGAVALMAFYESPISPLPVPALPEPPVGRFPPEMPNISPSVQVPFRTNQQQANQYANQYANQRSYPGAQAQPQQVLFPGQAAQQRQSAGSGPLMGGQPVQQLAANLLSSVAGKQASAQRKSSPDYEPSSSRSFFGAGQKLAAPANQQKASGSSLLGLFGLAGSPADQASGASGSSSGSGSSGAEQKALSNSHVVNKVKSYFARSPAGASQAAAPGAAPAANAANPYEQYQKMSLMQAIAKDTAFLPAFLAPNRKSSGPGQSGSSAANKLQQSISNVLSAAAGSSGPSAHGSAQPIAAASRMQLDSLAQVSPFNQVSQPAAPANGNKRASSGFGLMRAADRIAHALLDTVLQRHSSGQPAGPAQQQDVSGRKSASSLDDSSALMSTASLLGDLMLSSYTNGQPSSLVSSLAQAAGLPIASGPAASPAAEPASSSSSSSASSSSPAAAGDQQPAARSEPAAAPEPAQPAPAEQKTAKANQEHLVRKTRSIGLEYPTYEFANLQQPITAEQAQTPSKAAQINNLVDLVSDSYKQNKVLFNFVMNRVGLSHALPYVEQILGDGQVGLPNHLIQ